MEKKEIPSYQSKASVNALKIKKVVLDQVEATKTNRQSDGSAVLTPEDDSFEPIKVNDRFLQKNKVSDGGYLIFGETEKTFMSKEDFEENYELETSDEKPEE